MNKLLHVFAVLLLTCMTACATQPDITIPKSPPPPMVMKVRPRVALVLGGGGARGYAHVGVVKVLHEAGIPIDLIVGTSAGALVGAMYADTKDPKYLENIMLNAKFFDFADFAIFPPLRAPITGHKYQHFIQKNIHADNFNELKIPFVSTATDLKTGEQIVHSSGPLAPAINASSAMPGAVRPVELYGHLLTDGAMVAPVAVNVAKRYNPQMIIAVNVDNELPPVMPNTFVGVLRRAFTISWHKLGEYTASSADIVIHPKLGNGGPFDIHNKEVFYKSGIKAAQEALPNIRRLLASKTNVKLARQS